MVGISILWVEYSKCSARAEQMARMDGKDGCNILTRGKLERFRYSIG
jgi:hypothetical protein